MNDLLELVLNNEVLIKYRRNQKLAGLQRRYLEQMDTDMDAGVNIGGDRISDPTPSQRLRYVANYLVNAVVAGKENRITPACAYLAKAAPDLSQIRIDTTSNEHNFDLIFDS